MDSTLIHNPDVLECLANLSSDEVFTPPKVVNDMLDMLPQDLFASTTTKFLDPCCKSGIFLREIAKRLIAGTRDQYDSLQSCVDHIFHKQLFGIAITELTSLMSRRSLYCSKDPSCPYSASHFESVEGNIRFKSIQHAWNKGKCRFCGASESEYKRDSDKESHAYEFIHCANMRDLQNELFKTEYPDTYQEKDMHFDVIIGNPPYQMSDGGGNGKSAMPIYNLFINSAKKLNPDYLTMIIPSRWFGGGKGLDEFRFAMLSDKRMQKMIDFVNSTDCFTGVDIAGGICYFLWNRHYNGNCEITSHYNNKETKSIRDLNEFDVFVRHNPAVKIINKVRAICGDSVEYMSQAVLPRRPFGIDSNYKGNIGDVEVKTANGIYKINRSNITAGCELIDKYKVIISKVSSEHAGQSDKNGQYKVLSIVEVLPPNTVSSESYLIASSFDDQKSSCNLCTYIKTKFFRFLLLQQLYSQNISRERFSFIPIQDFSKPWTDAELYEKYGLSQEEIDFIESMIKPME